MTLENTGALEDQKQPAEAAEGTTEAGTGIDWKAEARKWEARAKKSAAAEAELAELKASQMTEAEKAAAHLAEVEAKLAELEAAQQKAADVAEVAKATGVPAGLLEYCADRDAMEAFAVEWQQQKTSAAKSAPSAEQSRINKGDGAQPSAKDEFVSYMARTIENQRRS